MEMPLGSELSYLFLIKMQPSEVPQPGLRMFLWTDGSMTKALEYLTLAPVTVSIVSEEPADSCPCEDMPGPYVRREVYLKAGETTLEHAVSYWNAEQYQANMGSKNSVGIGRTIRGAKMETHRQILAVRKVAMSEEVALQLQGTPEDTFYQREYLIFKEGKPLTHLTETFSSQILSYF